MVYSNGLHLVADSLRELHAFATQLGLKRSWFKNNLNGACYELYGGKLDMAVKYGAVQTDTKTIFILSENLLKEQLPKNLFKVGFTSHRSEYETPIDFEIVKKARVYIQTNWMPGKRLNKSFNSHKLSIYASDKTGITISNGELIAAAILEGYKYESSVVTALFYLDYENK